MKVLAGSYERFVFGWDLRSAAGTSEGTGSSAPALRLAFSYGAHLGPVKAVAASGNVAVSGGSDDVIRIYDLKAKADMGSLMQHEGGVTCLQFHGPTGAPTHLLSGGEDRRVCLWDCDTWEHLLTLKGHKAAVNSLAIHPCGRIALSVSRDASLCMWSLVQGKAGLITKLKNEAQIVQYAPQEGKTYAMAWSGYGGVGLHDSETGKELRTLEHPGEKVLAMQHYGDSLLLTGGDLAIVRAWDLRSPSTMLRIEKAHKSRIRGIAAPPQHSEGAGSYLLTTASSDGLVKAWDLRKIQQHKGGGGGGEEGAAIPIMEADSKARLTCLVMGGSLAGTETKAGTAIPVSENLHHTNGGAMEKPEAPEISQKKSKKQIVSKVELRSRKRPQGKQALVSGIKRQLKKGAERGSAKQQGASNKKKKKRVLPLDS